MLPLFVNKLQKTVRWFANNGKNMVDLCEWGDCSAKLEYLIACCCTMHLLPSFRYLENWTTVRLYWNVLVVAMHSGLWKLLFGPNLVRLTPTPSHVGFWCFALLIFFFLVTFFKSRIDSCMAASHFLTRALRTQKGSSRMILKFLSGRLRKG